MRVSDFSKRYEIRKLCSADIEAMSAICIGAFPLCGQAGINVSDSDITLETEDENWKEISDYILKLEREF